MLEDYGYTVESFTDSVEAFEKFRQDPDRFDLVITDYTMPEMSGEALTQEINSIRPDLPVVMCTGIALEPETFENVNLELILMKPLDMETLLTTVRDILDKDTSER